MHILATDYDGTLNRGGVSQADRDAIDRFRAAGNLFGVVTGRAGDMYDTLVRDHVPFDFVIVMNGAMTLDTDGNTVFEETADISCIRGIAELVGSGDYANFLSCVYHHTRHTYHAAHPDGNEKYDSMSKIGEFPRFTQLNTWVKTDELSRRLTAEINANFGEYVNALQNGVCIDITPAGIDKAVGISRLAEHLGVAHENIWTAGDNYNDLPMVKAFHGCAMERGVDELKKEAEFVCASVADVINKILER